VEVWSCRSGSGGGGGGVWEIGTFGSIKVFVRYISGAVLVVVIIDGVWRRGNVSQAVWYSAGLRC